MAMRSSSPRMIVFSTLFPNQSQPNAGVFIRERMFRVAEHLPLVVVAPLPWFPLQGLIRIFRPHFRPSAPSLEIQNGVEVYHPRFLSVPGAFKRLDGIFLALCSYFTMRHLCKIHDIRIIDSHFGYPDGFAATLLGRWLSLPVSITLRGTEIRHSRTKGLRERLIKALQDAQQIITVSSSLKQHAVALGIDAEKISVVGNGVDTGKFFPVDRGEACERWGLPKNGRFLITVGALVERKGFHRVIELMPALRERYPDLHYLVVGGASPEGDWTDKLREMVVRAGLEGCIHFVGSVAHEQMRELLSAADVFVLSTRNEGWANVLLEAMACRLPVITTDVGGNAEVVCQPELGRVVPFDDAAALEAAIDAALVTEWDRDAIAAYARENSWDDRVERLQRKFTALAGTTLVTDAPCC